MVVVGGLSGCHFRFVGWLKRRRSVTRLTTVTYGYRGASEIAGIPWGREDPFSIHEFVYRRTTTCVELALRLFHLDIAQHVDVHRGVSAEWAHDAPNT